MSGRLQLSSDPVGNGAPEPLSAEPTLDEFREAVLAAAIQARINQGRTYFPPVPPEELRSVEGGHLLRTEVAADFVQLMTAAREQLRVDQAGPPGRDSDSARQVTAIGLGSAYRDYARELSIWTSLFPQYYRATESEREAAGGGRHGPTAVNILVRYYSSRKAPPGFSNHSDGRAVDFITTQAGMSYGAEGSQRAAWRTTWLHQWLVANAQRFRFHPLASEEWHWDHP